MSTHSTLDIVVNDILRVVTPVQEDWEIRFAIINDLRSIVESVESLRGELFRNFVYVLYPLPLLLLVLIRVLLYLFTISTHDHICWLEVDITEPNVACCRPSKGMSVYDEGRSKKGLITFF